VEVNSIPVGSSLEKGKLKCICDIWVFFVSCWLQVFTETKHMYMYLKERFGATAAYMQLDYIH